MVGSVSMPLHWNSVKAGLNPHRFTACVRRSVGEVRPPRRRLCHFSRSSPVRYSEVAANPMSLAASILFLPKIELCKTTRCAGQWITPKGGHALFNTDPESSPAPMRYRRSLLRPDARAFGRAYKIGSLLQGLGTRGRLLQFFPLNFAELHSHCFLRTGRIGPSFEADPLRAASLICVNKVTVVLVAEVSPEIIQQRFHVDCPKPKLSVQHAG